MNSVVIIGLGSLVMSDEGVGVHVVRKLESRSAKLRGVDLVDAGAAGMKLLHLLAGRDRAILVDCAYMGLGPGDFRCFRPEDARSVKDMGGLSAHEGDLLRIAETMRMCGEKPPEMVFVGIQPAEVGPGMELSDRLAARLDEYVEAVAQLVS